MTSFYPKNADFLTAPRRLSLDSSLLFIIRAFEIFCKHSLAIVDDNSFDAILTMKILTDLYTHTAPVMIAPANPATTPMTTTVVSLELLLCASAFCAPKTKQYTALIGSDVRILSSKARN